MKNRLHLIKAVVLLIIIMSVYSCGPVATVLNIESRIPARYPVDFENRSIALFVSDDALPNSGDFLSQNDSLLMVVVATGIAKEFERKLSMDEGSVLVFNHYPGNERVYDIKYIQDLSFISNSDIVVILDSLRIGVPKVLDNIATVSKEVYGSYFMYAPVFSETKVYDGTTAELLTNIRQNDTVYWELYSRNDLRDAVMLSTVSNSSSSIAQSVGQQIVGKMFPSWIDQQRILFVSSKSESSNAYNLAIQFEWDKAMTIWLKETSHKDNIIVAAAAFNMAVACELTDRLDLALEWIDLSYKSYPMLPGVVSYKQFLKEKFETK